MDTRRRFVVVTAGTAAIAAVAANAATPAFLTAEEASLVEIIAGQIVPRDDAPGAIEAGVMHYIDQQLAGALQRFAPLYRENLRLFEPMRSMSAEKQLEFLQSTEKGEHGPAAARLFQVMIDHTMQGFYGSPIHGGNHDEASWKMLGIVQEMGGHGH